MIDEPQHGGEGENSLYPRTLRYQNFYGTRSSGSQHLYRPVEKRDLRVDIASVASQIKEKLNGKTASNFESEGEPIDIEIKVPEVSLDELQNVEIVQGEKKYRLGEIAEVSITTAPKEINRSNQNRIGKVTAMLEKGYTLGSVTPEIKAQLKDIQFPAKYSAQITGEEEKRAESFQGLSFALILSIVLVYMVMASQFESLRHPFTILLTIPLAGVGCIYAFLLAGASLNMMAFLSVSSCWQV